MFINRVGAGHGGKHRGKRPRSEQKIEPQLATTSVRGLPGEPKLSLPRGLETQAAAVLVGARIGVSRKDRRRGIVARNFMLYSV